MKNTHFSFLSLALAAVLATGCDTVKEQLGANREAPDEFAVITRAPLEMPQAYVLPPPQPGMPRPQEQSPQMRAKQAVFGQDAVQQQAQAQGKSDVEAALLNQAGAQADPNIRAVVDQEAAEGAGSEKTVVQKLMGLSGVAKTPNSRIVDPKAEAERIQENLKQGKPISEGETPSLKQ